MQLKRNPYARQISSISRRLAQSIQLVADRWQPAQGFFRIHQSVMSPLLRNFIFRKYRLNWALRYTCITVDARFRVNYKHIIIQMKRFHGTDHSAICISTVYAWFCNNIGHLTNLLRRLIFAVRTRRLQGNRNGKTGAASGIHIENYITLSILRMKTPDLKGKRAIQPRFFSQAICKAENSTFTSFANTRISLVL